MERRARGPFEGGVAAEYQSVMSIGPNKVMNGNCEPPSGRTSIRSSRPVAQFPPLYPILSALAPFSIRHESSPLIDFKSFNRIPAQGLDNHSQGVQRPIANHFHPPLFSPFSSDWILRTTLYLARHPSILLIPLFSTISNVKRSGRGRDLVNFHDNVEIRHAQRSILRGWKRVK